MMRLKPAILPALCFAAVTAALIVYSQTKAFAWDEGFHILAASLIRHGKKPYLDFVFSQTPLNACWNAAFMAVFGESWRVTHAVAAACTAAAVAWTASFILTRFPVPEWRVPGALMVLFMVGLNVLIFRFGGIAQAYGLCLLATVAAWRLISAHPFWAGLACGVAAGSSLLTAPVALVLLLWVRRSGAVAFLSGAGVAFLPVLVLFAQSPRQVYFGIIEYNLRFRQLGWPDATRHNLEVLSSWIDSGPALLLILLATTGLWFVRYRSDWNPETRSEYYLCAWLAAVTGAYLSLVRPTFERYYLFTVPFLGVLAVPGLYAIGRRKLVVLVVLLTACGLGRVLYRERDGITWRDLERTAQQVRQVTKPDQTLFADEAIYFLSGHAPPSGMEMRDSHKFDFPTAESAWFHLIPQAELDRRVKIGAADTLESCEEEDYIADHGYARIYRKRADSGDCAVFWDVRR